MIGKRTAFILQAKLQNCCLDQCQDSVSNFFASVDVLSIFHLASMNVMMVLILILKMNVVMNSGNASPAHYRTCTSNYVSQSVTSSSHVTLVM